MQQAANCFWAVQGENQAWSKLATHSSTKHCLIAEAECKLSQWVRTCGSCPIMSKSGSENHQSSVIGRHAVQSTIKARCETLPTSR